MITKLFLENTEKHTNIVQVFHMLIENVEKLCPEGRSRALALTRLQEGIFWVNYSLMGEVVNAEKEKEKTVS